MRHGQSSQLLIMVCNIHLFPKLWNKMFQEGRGKKPGYRLHLQPLAYSKPIELKIK